MYFVCFGDAIKCMIIIRMCDGNHGNLEVQDGSDKMTTDFAIKVRCKVTHRRRPASAIGQIRFG